MPWNRFGTILGLLLLGGCEGEPEGLTNDYATVKAQFKLVCTGCHSLDPIMNKHRDLAGWLETVHRMVIRGAKVDDTMAHDIARHLAHIRGPK